MALKVPASLVRHLNDGRCVLFVGAGLSAQAKLPSWGKLLSDLVQQVGADEPDEESTAELQKLLDAGRYLDVADECKERLGPAYAEFLSRTLQVGAGPVPEAHRLVMQLPFAAWITTNYDKLLEQAYFQVRGSVPKTLTHLDADTFGTLLFDGAPFILKAHGDVDKPESLIFTTRDYREIIHSNPAFQAIFSAILLTRAVLFVGYSLNDPDFRLLLDRQLTTFKKFVPERYAIMAGVGDVEREVLRRTAQIKVISYPAGQHEQLVEFLRALQTQIGGGAAGAASAPEPISRRTDRMSLELPSPRKGPRPGAPRDARNAALSDEDETTGTHAIAPLFDDGGGGAALATEATPPLRAPPQAQPVGGGRPAASAPPPAAPPIPPPSAAPPPQAMGEMPPKPKRDAAASKPVVLDVTGSPHGTSAVLLDGSGEIVAQGSGPRPSGRALSKMMAQSHSVTDYRAIGAGIAARLHPGTVHKLEELVGAGAPVALELSSDLEALPWELLEVAGQPLALRTPVSRSPVGLSTAARGRPMFRRPVRALLVGDPTEELPGARQEVERLAQLYPDATVLMGREATLDTVIAMLSGPDNFEVVHFAGHAWYDAQDVYLVLAGGAHLTDDLIRPGLSHRPPCVLFLNSHYTAFVPPGVSAKGAEPMKATTSGRMGFTEVAMRAGVGAFLGCFGSPTDEGAKAIALAFHQALLQGVSAAQALHRARTLTQLPAGDATPLLYALSGYGDLALE